MRLRLLRLSLVTAGFGWAISVYGLFGPWQAAVAQLHGLGTGEIPHDPMLDYWLRLGLEPIPFYVDTAFCLFTGTGIWLLRMEAGGIGTSLSIGGQAA